MVTLDLTTDFATVTDGLETVEFRGRAAGQKISVTAALRQSIGHKEAAASGGNYTSRDLIWWLQHASLSQDRMVGGRITDSTSAIYNVLEATYEPMGRTWRCVSRMLKLMSVRVTIQEASYSKGASGAQVKTWTDKWTSVAAHIEEQTRTEEEAADQLYQEQVFKVYIDRDLDLGKEHRIVGPDETIYKFVDYAGESLTELSTFTGLVDPFPGVK